MQNLDAWITNQLTQVDELLKGDQPEHILRHIVHVRSLLTTHKLLLLRLQAAERFCVAARSLAEYKKPLEHVLNHLDAWERLVNVKAPPKEEDDGC